MRSVLSQWKGLEIETVPARHVRERAQEPIPLDGGARKERVSRHLVVERRIRRPQRLEVADEEWVRDIRAQQVLLRDVAHVAAVEPLLRQIVLPDRAIEAITPAAVVRD